MLCSPCCCCCNPRRARRCEPARRGVCQRQTPTGRGEAADRGTCPPGRPALRHLQTATGQSRLCQQNPRQVKGGGSTVTSAIYVCQTSIFSCAPSSISASVIGYKGRSSLFLERSNSASEIFYPSPGALQEKSTMIFAESLQLNNNNIIP